MGANCLINIQAFSQGSRIKKRKKGYFHNIQKCIFRKSIFWKCIFRKRYFLKVYFLKVYFPKLYFRQVYLSKIYLCKMYPNCMSSKLWEFIHICNVDNCHKTLKKYICKIMKITMDYGIAKRKISNFFERLSVLTLKKYILPRKMNHDWNISSLCCVKSVVLSHWISNIFMQLGLLMQSKPEIEFLYFCGI